mmetsp:Transcript_17491/g.36080  ORF Transcript_17491/g.36080 Transcript_17491/m.36080 type:complete len:92 (-) Transcript_17491:278-553(-)
MDTNTLCAQFRLLIVKCFAKLQRTLSSDERKIIFSVVKFFVFSVKVMNSVMIRSSRIFIPFPSHFRAHVSYKNLKLQFFRRIESIAPFFET